MDVYYVSGIICITKKKEYKHNYIVRQALNLYMLSLLPSAHTEHLKTSLEEELEEESTLIAFIDLIWGILALPLHTVYW